ncbi:hypothetical protein GALMADRAFT_238619 [Galerina marginata CBS 339.88]|uniref:CsbD-like domain-containing protein n=1 Tax=Galerina marginata (strain CBS 339.88) TaxID=685588 RepID=A0A067TIK1_GALM3|nr:hypothetical protein GALMADRAFT_238619 [Galerina marginata CBS 339.88]
MGTNTGMGTIDNHQGIGEGTHTGHQHDPGTGPSMAPMANGSTEGNRREHNSKATIRDAPTCFSPASAFITGARADLQQAAGVTRTGYVDATGPGSNQNSAGKSERDTHQGSSTTGKTKSDGGKDAMPRERPTIKDKIIGRTEKIAGKLIANAEMVDRGEERMAGTYEAAKN